MYFAAPAYIFSSLNIDVKGDWIYDFDAYIMKIKKELLEYQKNPILTKSQLSGLIPKSNNITLKNKDEEEHQPYLKDSLRKSMRNRLSLDSYNTNDKSKHNLQISSREKKSTKNSNRCGTSEFFIPGNFINENENDQIYQPKNLNEKEKQSKDDVSVDYYLHNCDSVQNF